MPFKGTLKFLSTISLVFCCIQVSAQEAPDQSSKSFTAVRTNQAPRIDGDLSDPAWQNAAQVSDFLQREPFEYNEASERTDVYMMYDEDAIYFGFYLHDSRPDEITAKVLEQGGNIREEDRIRIIIDPFNDQRSGFLFQTNPNGVRDQGIFISGTQVSFDWEGIWNSAARIVEDGWTAEVEIPFKSLSFDPENDTWGVNFQRDLRRNQESMAWYSFGGEVDPARAGQMRGISNISQGIGLDIIPALSGSSFEDHRIGQTDSNFEPSVDLFYKITPQINLALTLNTDFSATEADTNTLNNTRFRRFFEEQRAFFLNDFDSFKFGLDDLQIAGAESGNNALAFYSRRIGLSEEGTPVDIVGGTKLSGQLGDTEFGLLVMRQDETIIDDNGTDLVIEATDAVVARVSQSILGESKIGLIYTNGNPAENQRNSLFGLDFQYRDSNFYDGKSLDIVSVFQRSNDPDFDGDQDSYSVAFEIDDSEGWTGGGQYFVVEENYSPGLGFTQRVNSELISGQIQYRWRFRGSEYFQELISRVGITRWTDVDTGDLDTNELEIIPFFLRLNRGDTFRLRIQNTEEVVLDGRDPSGDLNLGIPAGTYTDLVYDFRYQTPTYYNLTGAITLAQGDFFTGERFNINPEANWQINRHLMIGVGYDLTQFEFDDRTIYTREVELDLNIAFNSNISLTSRIEYDDVRDQATFTNRLRWNLQAGQDLFVVFNQGLVDENENLNFSAETTAAAFKFRYTLRF